MNAQEQLKPLLQQLAESEQGRELLVHSEEFIRPSVVLYRTNPGQYETTVKAVKASGVRITAWEKRIRDIAASEERREAAANDDGRQLQRGDHVELAEILLGELQGESRVEPVADQGDLFAYDPLTGLWRKIEEEESTRILSSLAGSWINDGERASRLKLRASDIDGARNIALQRVKKRGFFAAAPDGVAFTNGFLAMENNKAVLQTHDPKNRATFSLPFAYDPTAQAPRWEQYLREVFLGQPDVEERIALVEEWIGLVLFGLIVRYQVCLVAIGRHGSEGKSVLLHVLRQLFPAEATRSISPQLWSSPFSLAQLAGARINLVNELPDADVTAGEVFKAVVTGDAVQAQHKFKDPFDLVARAGHLFACNELPGTRDQSGGFWRRWIVLTFERTFAPHEQDPNLRHDIARNELPGIAARVVAAVERFLARGKFDTPQTSVAAKEAWRLEADQVRQFFSDADAMDRLIYQNRFRSPTEKHGSGTRWTRAKHLYNAYKEWSEANGHSLLSNTKFGARAKSVLGADRCERLATGAWYRVGSDEDPSGNPPQRERGDVGYVGSVGFSESTHNGEEEDPFSVDFSERVGVTAEEPSTSLQTLQGPGKGHTEPLTGLVNKTQQKTLQAPPWQKRGAA